MERLSLATFNRDDQSATGQLYARSYLLIRLLIGLTGFMLPLLLIVIDWFFMTEGRQLRGSLSAYYHTPARDLFVGGLFVVGSLLLTYMAAQPRTWDFVLSSSAGLLLLVVAVVPTQRPGLPAGAPRCGDSELTPPGCTAVQQRFGEHALGVVHGVAAVGFVVLLAALCVVFALRERRFRGKRRRVLLYFGCAAVIGLAGLWALLGWSPTLFGKTFNHVYVGEFVAFYAFSVSWFAASWDLVRRLLRRAPDLSGLTRTPGA